MRPRDYVRLSKNTSLALLAVIWAACLIGLIALVLSTPAKANDRWQIVNTNDRGESILLDTASLKVNGMQASFWTKFEGKKFTLVVRNELNCNTEQYRNVEMYSQSPNGYSEEIPIADRSWSTPVPESVFEYIVTNLCAGIRQRPENQ